MDCVISDELGLCAPCVTMKVLQVRVCVCACKEGKRKTYHKIPVAFPFIYQQQIINGNEDKWLQLWWNEYYMSAIFFFFWVPFHSLTLILSLFLFHSDSLTRNVYVQLNAGCWCCCSYYKAFKKSIAMRAPTHSSRGTGKKFLLKRLECWIVSVRNARNRERGRERA